MSLRLVVRGGAISSIAGDRPPTVKVDPALIGEPDPAALRSPTSMIGRSRMTDRTLTDRARNVAATLRVWGADEFADTVKEMIVELEKEEGN